MKKNLILLKRLGTSKYDDPFVGAPFLTNIYFLIKSLKEGAYAVGRNATCRNANCRKVGQKVHFVEKKFW